MFSPSRTLATLMLAAIGAASVAIGGAQAEGARDYRSLEAAAGAEVYTVSAQLPTIERIALHVPAIEGRMPEPLSVAAAVTGTGLPEPLSVAVVVAPVSEDYAQLLSVVGLSEIR